MTWRHWRTSLAYALLLVVVSVVGPRILSSKALQIFQVEQLFSQDLELNDLYYRLGSWKDAPRMHEVVVVNTARLGGQGPADFRSECAELVQRLDRMAPSVIGVDLLFRDTTASDGLAFHRASRRVFQSLERTPRVVVAAKAGADQAHIELNQESGIVNFPDSGRVSIRSYRRAFEEEQGARLSFGAALVERHRPGAMDVQEVPEVFPLRYGKEVSLMTPIRAGAQARYAGRRTPGIPIIDAREFMQHPDSFAAWIRGAMVVVGHASDDRFDIEDKHRVPCDTILVNRLPTFSGPIIHAIAADNMLHFSQRGWRFVPEWLRSLAALTLLVSLIHLLLHTRFGKWANFVVLALATLPLIYLGFLLMSWGYYWPMNSTLLPFVFIEEIMEVVVPISKKLVGLVKRKFKWLGATAACLALPILSQGQSIEVLMLQGRAECRGLEYSPEAYDSFVVHPGDIISFTGDCQAMLLDLETEKSAVCLEAGALDWTALRQMIQKDDPSLGSEMIRLFLSEGIANQAKEANVGAATRGDGGYMMLPSKGSTVTADSVWIGFNAKEVLPPSGLEISIRNGAGDIVSRSGERVGNGFWWRVPGEGQWRAEATLFGTSIAESDFRTEGATAEGRLQRLRQVALSRCLDCPHAQLDSLRSKWRLQPE